MSTKDLLLNRVFGDPDTQHGLVLFDAGEIEALPLEEKDGKIYVDCFVSDKKRLAKPEEIVRQLVARQLSNRLGYPVTRIAVEVPIKMGATYASKKADIVVYREDAKITPHIIVEVKKPRRKDGLDQLHSYMNATGVHFGAWNNGIELVPQLRLEPNLFEVVRRLPGNGEDVDDIKTPITKSELQPIQDLKEEIQYLENAVLANAGVSTFEEIFKLIFAKLYDEDDKGETEAVEFRITTASPAQQYKRINDLFKKAREKWHGIFADTDRIDLSPQALVAVASEFQIKKLFDADLDVIDAAFEYMINPEQKGDKGQYFTPRPVVKMCVKMLNPKPDESILDPACGPGGFLIHALHWVTEQHLRARYTKALEKRKFDYANSRLFGIDFDQRLVRVAKAMMLIAGDGKANVYRVNSLDSREWEGRTDGLVEAVQDAAFDLIMTNPPFAGSITAPEILGGYDVAYKGDPSTHKRSGKMTRDVLFIERSLRHLRPGGRMAIVLPQGNLNNTSAEWLQEWLLDQGRLFAVVGLHGNTFKPFTNTKTSVVFVQKWREDEEKRDDYSVFLAVNKRPVKDSSGRCLYLKNLGGSYRTDSSGRRVIDHDLDDIASAFVEFAEQERLTFWREGAPDAG